ncbi:unnamed protein product [Acanthosepion pharaonis]|uniref:Uncharacterized protein n=1 Tax=Acanthosepion pharaonis TaxID=158019 RepID=A0A812DYM2_ACAPH|nr:unnamed protein product [Sepia pharaonis]
MTSSPVSYRLLRTGDSLPSLIFPQISRDSLDNGLVPRVSLPSFSSTVTCNGRLRVLTHVPTNRGLSHLSLPSGLFRLAQQSACNGCLWVLTHVMTLCRPIAVSPIWPLLSACSTATRNGLLRVLTHVTTMCRPIAVSPVSLSHLASSVSSNRLLPLQHYYAGLYR